MSAILHFERFGHESKLKMKSFHALGERLAVYCKFSATVSNALQLKVWSLPKKKVEIRYFFVNFEQIPCSEINRFVKDFPVFCSKINCIFSIEKFSVRILIVFIKNERGQNANIFLTLSDFDQKMKID